MTRTRTKRSAARLDASVAASQLGVLARDDGAREAVLAAGFETIDAVASAPRAAFVARLAKHLDAAEAVRLHTRARAQRQVLAQTVLGRRGATASADDVGAETGPAAYLLDLMNYACDVLLNADKPVTVQWLTGTFCQPFAALAASPDAERQPVPQVRICIEVLRAYFTGKGVSPGTPPSYLMAAYTDALVAIGTSFSEMQLALHANTASRQLLASRLGIAETHLDALYVAPASLSEPLLASLFGLADTTAVFPPPTPPAPSQLSVWRLEYLAELWHKSDWPDDPPANARPIIDPDLIGDGDIAHAVSGNAAFDLLVARRADVSAMLQHLDKLRRDAATQPDGFRDVVNDALGIAPSMLWDWAQRRAAGEDIGERLAGVALTSAAFNYLISMYQILFPSSGRSIDLTDDEWSSVYSILTESWKRRNWFTPWRTAEKDRDICLTPEWFRIPEPDASVFPPPPPRELPPWRASLDDLTTWDDTLRARIDQRDTSDAALGATVNAVGAATLPALRSYLISQIDLPPGVIDKAAWFAETFQIDTTITGTQQITRVGQAIEAVQGVLWAVRTGQLADVYPTLTIFNNNAFDRDWAYMGTYASWRAHKLVLLYPSNFLQPSLRPWQSPAFSDLVSAARGFRQLGVTQARQIAATYAAFFRDICALDVDASALARTRVGADGDPGGAHRDLYYTFARGSITQRPYWSAWDSKDATGYSLTPWAPVPGVSSVFDIIGAEPYDVAANRRYLYLFVILRDGEARKLAFTRYDLEARVWDTAPTVLPTPEQSAEFTGVLVQRLTNAGGVLPSLVLRLADGSYWRAALRASGAGLTAAGWTRLDARLADTQTLHAYLVGDAGAWWGVVDGTDGTLKIIASSGKNYSAQANFVGLINFPENGAYLVFQRYYITDAAYYVNLLDPVTDSELHGVTAPIRIGVATGITTPAPVRRLSWFASDGAFHAEFSSNGGSLTVGAPTRIAPLIENGPFEITDQLSESELQARATLVDDDFTANASAPASVFEYLKEAYYFVPMQLALQLQECNQYTPALDWLRTVYDYTQPSMPRGRDGSPPPGARWMSMRPSPEFAAMRLVSDPLNAHAIAAARPDELARATIASIASCMLNYGDSEFTRDSSESVQRARSLYGNALKLLARIAPVVPMRASAGETRPRLVDAIDAVLADARTAALARDAGEQAERSIRSGGGDGVARLPTIIGADPAPNPVVDALTQHGQLNLYKLQNGRNIAGVVRQLDTFVPAADQDSGFPVIGGDGPLTLPAPGNRLPTPYRYAALIERAKQFVQLAAQTESAMLSAFEKRDAESYNIMRARQDLGLAQANVQLQDLRVQEAQVGVSLAAAQQQRSQMQVDYYDGLIEAGDSSLEKQSLDLMQTSVYLQYGAAAANYLAAALPGSISSGFPSGVTVSVSPQGSAMAVASALSAVAGATSSQAAVLSTLASYERRMQEWTFQSAVSQQDARIGALQVTASQNQVRVAGQERNIAQMQANNAAATVEYLATKFTNVALYDWMSQVLEGVYRFFLQQAIGLARVAAEQLAFERQTPAPAIIQSDYWEPSSSGSVLDAGPADSKHGLTGSARLLQDIYRLDQWAFDTAKRKLQLTKTVSLYRLSPIEFERLRRDGVMQFATPMAMFDQDYPGHYLRLISRVRVSLIALIPAVESIHATLTASGASRVVVPDAYAFRAVTQYRQPEMVALTSPRDATGLFDLQAVQGEMLLPFEAMGVDTSWEFRLPKASNRFDYRSLMDVLVTFELTALSSDAYATQVMRSLDPSLSSDRPFSFRQEFPDQWFDLNNPGQSATPMEVEWRTEGNDFPPNLLNLSVQQVVLFFVRAKTDFEVLVTDFTFATGDAPPVGGTAQSIDGVISTRRGNAPTWLPMIGRSPLGTWRLKLPDTPDMRARFTSGDITDILFVVTYRGRTPPWPS